MEGSYVSIAATSSCCNANHSSLRKTSGEMPDAFNCRHRSEGYGAKAFASVNTLAIWMNLPQAHLAGRFGTGVDDPISDSLFCIIIEVESEWLQFRAWRSQHVFYSIRCNRHVGRKSTPLNCMWRTRASSCSEYNGVPNVLSLSRLVTVSTRFRPWHSHQ
jgi:hypothetical protein